NRAHALRTRRLHVIDTIGAGNHTLKRSGDESANQICISADVYRRNLHDGDVAAGILSHTQRANRLQTSDQNYQIDTDCQYRSLDEEIRELHLVVLRLGSRIVAGLNFIVHSHSRTVAQLEDTGSDHLVPWLKSRDNTNLIATRTFNFHELLTYAAVGLTGWTF